MEKYIFIAAVILGLIEIALYQIKDIKKRFIGMAYVGVFAMGLILVGTIVAEMDGATIYMAILMVGYIISLSFIWKKITKGEIIDKGNSVQNDFKLLQFRKEESWLNKMSEEKKALNKITYNLYFRTFYSFSACEPGEFVYHIEYQKDADIDECISYMQAQGAEFICKKPAGFSKTSTKKLYFRKKRMSGGFQGFYDKSELIKSANKHIQLGLIIGTLYLIPGVLLIVFFPKEPLAGILLCIMAFLFLLIAYWGYRKKNELSDIPSYKD